MEQSVFRATFTVIREGYKSPPSPTIFFETEAAIFKFAKALTNHLVKGSELEVDVRKIEVFSEAEAERLVEEVFSLMFRNDENQPETPQEEPQQGKPQMIVLPRAPKSSQDIN